MTKSKRTTKSTTTKSGPTRAVVYVRISKDRDNQTSIESQERACRAYAEQHGWQVVAVETDQGRSAYSGKDRPGFNRARHMIDNGLADVLLVWALDRAVRSVADLAALLGRLDDVDAGLASATQPVDTTTPMGRAMVQIIGVLAELESAMKSERMTEYHYNRRRNGAPAGGPRSFGYRRDGSGSLEVDGVEMEHVLAVFEQYRDGVSMNAIADALNAAKVKTSTGKAFYCQTVRDMLDNPIYAGRMVHDGIEVDAPWQAIVPVELFEQVRAMRKRTVRPRAKYDRALLTGLIRCGRCDSPMHGGLVSKGGPRYTCSAKGCYNGVLAASADALVVESTIDMIDPVKWADMLNASKGVDPTVEIRARIEQLAADEAADLITRDEWLAKRAVLVERLAAAESKGVVRTELPNVKCIRTAWPKLDIDVRRAVLAGVVEKINLAPATNRGRFDAERFVVTERY